MEPANHLENRVRDLEAEGRVRGEGAVGQVLMAGGRRASRLFQEIQVLARAQTDQAAVLWVKVKEGRSAEGRRCGTGDLKKRGAEEAAEAAAETSLDGFGSPAKQLETKTKE